MAKDKNKKKRQKVYKELSHERFLSQRQKMFLPNICYFAVTLLLFVILLIWDSPKVVFDDTSCVYAYLLIVIIAIPLISLGIIYFSKKTMHLLLTISLHTLSVLPLMYGFWFRYDGLKNCNSYHMLIIYFGYFIVFITMTTVFSKIRKNYLNYDDSL